MTENLYERSYYSLYANLFTGQCGVSIRQQKKIFHEQTSLFWRWSGLRCLTVISRQSVNRHTNSKAVTHITAVKSSGRLCSAGENDKWCSAGRGFTHIHTTSSHAKGMSICRSTTCFDWSISAIIQWIGIKFRTDIYGTHRINPDDSGGPLVFPLAQNKDWMNCYETL